MMMKDFLKAMWIGAKEIFRELLLIIIILLVGCTSIFIGYLILTTVEKNPSDEMILMMVIWSLVIGLSIYCVIIRAIETVRYSKKYNVSMEEGWEATK